MSWSLSIHLYNDSGQTPDAAVSDAVAEYKRGSDPPDHVRDALDQAADHALSLLESDAVGSIDRHSFTIALSGHANPDHEPAEGWANDFIQVSVSQA